MADAPDVRSLKRRLFSALALNAAIVAAEVGIGLRVHSVGLLSDAGHNTIDQGALFMTLYAHLLSLRPPSAARTFGYHRAGIVAAFLNAFVLLLTAACLAATAGWRLMHPVPVAGAWVMGAAFVSFAANLTIALILRRDAEDDLNIRSAFWHMLGDAWVAFGVVASGAAIYFKGWNFLDPLISLAIVVVVVRGAWFVFHESLEVLMEAAPAEVALPSLVQALEGIAGGGGVHDLHLWTIKPGLSMLSCHLTTRRADVPSRERLLEEARACLAARFNIRHATLQIETDCSSPDGLHCDLNRKC